MAWQTTLISPRFTRGRSRLRFRIAPHLRPRPLLPGASPFPSAWTEFRYTLYAYRLPAEPFQPADAAVVATTEVEPLGPPERVGDLFELHAEAGIQLRVLPHLHDFWDAVVASTLEFSGIRLRNAVAR